MPARIVRFSVPMSTSSFSSLSAPATRSACSTRPTRSFTLRKSSMVIVSPVAAAGAAPATGGVASG
jgi:hypothetical protein